MQASYPDGTRRKGWQDLRTANKLSQEAATTKSQESRKQIATEIRRLGVRVSKDV